jgi:hypothetical protein
MSPGGNDSGAFGFTAPLADVDDAGVDEDDLAGVDAAAEFEDELVDEPHPASVTATPSRVRAGIFRIGPP